RESYSLSSARVETGGGTERRSPVFICRRRRWTAAGDSALQRDLRGRPEIGTDAGPGRGVATARIGHPAPDCRIGAPTSLCACRRGWLARASHAYSRKKL